MLINMGNILCTVLLAPFSYQIYIQDNSYSKIHSKMLTYFIKVITRGEFDHVKATLGEIVKQRHAFDVRRSALRTAFEKICEKMIISGASDDSEEASLHSMSVLSSIGAGGPMNSGQSRGGSSLLYELQQEIHRLQDEDRSMRMELSSIQFILNQRNEEIDALREEFDKAQAFMEAFDTERSVLQVSLDEAKNNIDYERNRRIKLEQHIDSINRELQLEHADAIAKLKRDFDMLAEEKMGLEAKCNQLKGDKRQLKNAAIKFKTNLEQAMKQVEELVSVRATLQEENNKLLAASRTSSQISTPTNISEPQPKLSESRKGPESASTLERLDENESVLETTPDRISSSVPEGLSVSGSSSVEKKKVETGRLGIAGRRRILLENSFGF